MSSRISLEERLQRIYYLSEKKNSQRGPGLSRISESSSVYVDENTEDLEACDFRKSGTLHDDHFDVFLQSNAVEMREFTIEKYNKIEEEQEFMEDFGLTFARNPNRLIEKTLEIELNPSMCTMLSLMNSQFSDEQIIQLEEERESLGLSPIYKCLEIPQHLGKARIICFEITKSLSSLPNCIRIIAHWCRSRLFPDTTMELENRWMMMNIFFSYIDFGIVTKEGIIFFESFSKLIDDLKLAVSYHITKHRFAFPIHLLDDFSENENELNEIMFSKCFYAPQYKSDKNAEIKHFAHNDILHEFSAIFRKNLILALIYFRLRSIIGDQKVFESYQRIFKNNCEYLNYLLYTKSFDHQIPPCMIQFLMNLRETILDQRLFRRFIENMYKYDALPDD